MKAARESIEHEHVPIRIPHGKQLTCKMCRWRAEAHGIKAKEKGGGCAASFMCKVCHIVMHDTHEDRMQHIQMVKENHPKLHLCIRYDEKVHLPPSKQVLEKMQKQKSKGQKKKKKKKK